MINKNKIQPVNTTRGYKKYISNYFLKIKWFLSPFLVLMSALLLACASGYFSIYGLSKLFAGAATSVIIMATTLEFAKIIGANYLHQFWSKTNKIMRAYMVSSIVILSLITSLGIFGFLSNAYSITSSEIGKQNSEISFLEEKEKIYEYEKESIEKYNISKIDRIKTLSDIRNQQENRLDTLYKKNMWSGIKKTEQVIKDANDEISSLNKEVQINNDETKVINDSIRSLKIRIIEIKNSDASIEAAPLMFVSKILNKSMDTVVSWFIIIFIFVFDPLAIVLILSSNVAFKERKEEYYNYINRSYKYKNTINNEVELDSIPDKVEEKCVDTYCEGVKIDNSVNETSESTDNSDVNIINKVETINYNDVIKKGKYHKILESIYQGGVVKTGQEIPSYNNLTEFLSGNGFIVTDDNSISRNENIITKKEISEFIVICQLLKIIEIIPSGDKVASKSYEQAIELVNLMVI